MAQLNYPWNLHVTKSRSILLEIGAQHQRDQCQNFSLGHNFMNKTFDWSKISKNWFHKIIHKFGSVTTKWLVFQKAPPFIFIWLLKWSCLGHNKMNQAKNPECQAGRVDITVEQCVELLIKWRVHEKPKLYVSPIHWWKHFSHSFHYWTPSKSLQKLQKSIEMIVRP